MTFNTQDHGFLIGEILFVTIIMTSGIAMFTYIDITVHDFYAQPVASHCYETNLSEFCQEFRELHGCTPEQGYYCMVTRYWTMLQLQMVWLGGMLIFTRLALVKLLGRRMTPERILAAFAWGIAPVILLMTGWEDYLYYTARGMPIPETLPWLDNASMGIVNAMLGLPTTTTLSLYIMMAIGLFMVIGLFVAKSAAMARAGLRTPI